MYIHLHEVELSVQQPLLPHMVKLQTETAADSSKNYHVDRYSTYYDYVLLPWL